MKTVKLYLSNDTIWEYEAVTNTNKYIYMRDQDGTQMIYDKDVNRLYQYDNYEGLWKFMCNTTSMINKIEVV